MKNFISIFSLYFLMLCNVWADITPSATTSNAPVINDTPAVSTLPALPPPATATPLTLEQATKQVIGNHNASRVLSAKTEEFEGRKVHVVKTLTQDGHIQQQVIDADTGVFVDFDDNKSDPPKE